MDEFIEVWHFNPIRQTWWKSKVMAKSEVMKALNGEEGEHFDLLRKQYRKLEDDPNMVRSFE